MYFFRPKLCIQWLTRFRIEMQKEKKGAFDAREICAKDTTDIISCCIFNTDAEISQKYLSIF